MKEYALVVNFDRFINCLACEIACELNHKLPPGLSRIKIIKHEAKQEQGRVMQDFIPTLCVQCKERPCLAVCSFDALKEINGITHIEREQCTGCGECIESCPYGMVTMDNSLGVADKCNLCLERGSDLPPYCVENCWGGALMWIPLEVLSDQLKKREDGSCKRVIYISQRRDLPQVRY